MTFSIVARSADGRHWGVAVASKFLAAGAVVPAAQVGAGAIATQSLVNLRYLPDGLALLAGGVPAQEALDALTGADTERDQRQAGLVDAQGRSAAFTGVDCIPWAGRASGQDHSAQGNCLTGPEVVAQMSATFLASGSSTPLADRLLAALRAGQDAGGDRRGRQSAALLVVTEGGGYGGGSDVALDLRVDDHADPVTELERLAGELAEDVSARLTKLGHDGNGDGRGTLDERLFAWMAWENYEERHVAGSIDPVVLERLRNASA